MPKEFICRQIKNGELCGETNPENFSSGRYTACKSCRSKMASKLLNEKKIKDKDDKANFLDPDEDTRYLIEDTIKRIPLINNKTVQEAIRDIDEMNSLNTSEIGDLNDLLKTLMQRIKVLEEKLHSLQTPS